MDKNFTKDFQVKEISKFKIKDFSTTYKGKLNKEEGEKLTRRKKNSMNYKKNSMQMAANLF
jgi:hypothetical protein